MAYNLKFDLERILEIRLSSGMITDSKPLFYGLTSAICTTEKRLMTKIQTVENTYKSFEVTDIALARSEYNTADALTNYKAQ